MISKDKIATLPTDKQASIEKRIHKVEQTYVRASIRKCVQKPILIYHKKII